MILRMSLTAAVLLAQPVAAVAQHMGLPDAPCRGVVVTADASRCSWRAATAADEHLETYLSQVKRVLAPSEIADLDKVQSLWAQYREADCAAERGLYGRGTGGPVTYYACLEAQSRARLTDLQAVYGWTLTK